jgi:hypothetical protein
LADGNTHVHAFVFQPGTLDYQNGTLTEIGLGSQYNNYGYAINNNGDVVGSTYFEGSTVGAPPLSGGIRHGFLYAYDPISRAEEMFDLNNLVDPTLNLVITSATGINDSGWISADALDYDGNIHALLLQPGFPPFLNPRLAGQFDVVPLFDPNPAPVPEPSSVALLGIGLGVASFVSWRRRTRRRDSVA